ncbi:MAG: uracil-DNA glycosylase [Gammaproteobacteria bacterium]|nr:uracil-DNA glycosylase [Gammaproteobacteria bacterium]
MTTQLKDALREVLVDWQSDLSSNWRSIVDEVELAFDDVDETLELHPWEPIFPSRRHFFLPGEPEGAHMLHAFDGLPPEAVRCVLIGQDPYPNIAFCTGRAFESGEHRSWRELDNMRSRSMRCLIQSVYAFRSGRVSHTLEVEGWPATLEAITALENGFPTPAELAQSWVDQGVLLLNASLTLTRFAVDGDPHQTCGHLPLWRPLMAHLLRYFANRSGQPVVFLLFGHAAQSVANASGIVDGTSVHRHPAIVVSPHPAEGNRFLEGSNPFVSCNSKLLAMDAAPIHW